jgi:hypothetical protein
MKINAEDFILGAVRLACLITEMASLSPELSAPNIHNKAQTDRQHHFPSFALR